MEKHSKKITEIHYWGHASYSMFSQGYHLLMDPVLEEPFEHGFTYFNPSRQIDKSKIPFVSAIYISHSHGDHFDERTLKYFLKITPPPPQIFCPDDSKLLKSLRLWGFNKITALRAWEEVSFGPYTLLATPSLSPFNELGALIKTSDIIIWNQVDTSADFYTIWKARRHYKRGIDILFCPFQPLKEYGLNWPRETEFPKKRLKNMLTKALAAHSRYIVPSSSSIKLGGHWQFGNTKHFSLSKPEFIERLKKLSPSVRAYDMEAGESLSLQANKLLVQPSFFIKRKGKRIEFHNQPHPDTPPLVSRNISKEEREKIIFHFKKLPSFVFELIKIKFMYVFECLLANNYTVVFEILNKGEDLTFTWRDQLKNFVQEPPPKNWDYWFQCSADNLLKKLQEPADYIPWYAWRNPSHNNIESPLSLYGYNEDHVVDGGIGHYDIFYWWPFSSSFLHQVAIEETASDSM